MKHKVYGIDYKLEYTPENRVPQKLRIKTVDRQTIFEFELRLFYLNTEPSHDFQIVIKLCIIVGTQIVKIVEQP